MEQSVFQNTYQQKSRDEKIREAKSCFKASGAFHSVSGWKEDTKDSDDDFLEEESYGRPFGLYRFIAAVSLFFILITAFHFELSYHGWNQEKMERVLSDDSHYQYIVKQAETVIRTIGITEKMHIKN